MRGFLAYFLDTLQVSEFFFQEILKTRHHVPRDRKIARQHLFHRVYAAYARNQVHGGEFHLIHEELYHVDSGGRRDGVMHLLVAFDLIEEQVALISFRCATLRLKHFTKSGARDLVLRLSLNWLYVCHIYTSRAFMRSYSA